MGESIELLAAWIQEDLDLCVVIGRASLITALHRYRRDVLDLAPTNDPAHAKRPQAPTRREKHAGLDELSELGHLFELQLQRVAWAVELEGQHGRVGRVAREEIDLSKRLLTVAHDMKMDFGVGRAQEVPVLQVAAHWQGLEDIHGRQIVETAQNAWSAGKILALLDRLRTLSRRVDDDAD